MSDSPQQKRPTLAIFVISLLIIAAAWIGYSTLAQEEFESVVEEVRGFVIIDGGPDSTIQESSKPSKKKVAHHKTPDQAKIGYMTSWVAGTPSIREPLIDFFVESEFNGVIIDIKDDTGRISYQGNNPDIEAVGSYENRIPDIQELIEELHEKGLYVVGRVAVFQDPYLTGVWSDQAVKNSSGNVWKDRKGLSWMDASSQKVWDYVIKIAKESYDLGFDEINFDYVRFPTDGSGDMVFPLSGNREMSSVIEEFFIYLEKELEVGEYKDMVRSADLFGLTTSAADDLGIGQVLEKAVGHFDYIGPMTYPSHYGPGFAGLQNPNSAPGVVIARAMEDAKVKLANHVDREVAQYAKQFTKTIQETDPDTGLTTTRTEISSKDQKKIDEKRAELEKRFDFQKIRPWLQDFDYGGDYGYTEVRAQIDAVYASGLDSWFIWDPSNKYTKEAY